MQKKGIYFLILLMSFFLGPVNNSFAISTFYQGLTYPTGIAVHPNEPTLYVISGTSGSVWSIGINSNGSSGALNLITESFPSNLDIDFDAAGNLYGLNTGTHVIIKLLTNGIVEEISRCCVSKGSAMTIEKPGLPTNKIYYARQNKNSIEYSDLSSGSVEIISSCSNSFRFFYYRQLLNDIIATFEDRVVSINPGTGTCTEMITGMVQPMGIAVDTAGNVYTADSGNGQIKMKNNLGVIKTIASGIDSPTGLAYDELTNILFIAESGTGKILKINLNDTEVCPEGIVFAYNPITGAKGAFVSVCEVPYGWRPSDIAPDWFLNATGLKQPKIPIVIPLGD